MKNKVFIKNLSDKTTELEIGNALKDLVNVKSISIFKEKSFYNPKKFAIVELFSSEETKKVIESLDNREINGNIIRVIEASPIKIPK